MENKGRRGDEEAAAFILAANPLVDVVDIKLDFGGSALLVNFSNLEAVNMAIMPGQRLKILGRPSAHRY